MLLTLHISKSGTGDYCAYVREGTHQLGHYDASSITEAILLAAENPLPDLVGFHLWFEQVYSGTVSAREMRADSEGLARRLMALNAGFSFSKQSNGTLGSALNGNAVLNESVNLC